MNTSTVKTTDQRRLNLHQFGQLRGEFLLYGGVNQRMDCGRELKIEFVQYHGIVRFFDGKPVHRFEMMIHGSRFHATPERVYFDNTCRRVYDLLLKLNPGDRVRLITKFTTLKVPSIKDEVEFYVMDIPGIDIFEPGTIDDGNRGYCVSLRRDW